MDNGQLFLFSAVADMESGAFHQEKAFAEHDKRKALRNSFFHYQLSIINYGVAESRY